MPSTELFTIEEQVALQGDVKRPPLHLWHPPLSGDIAIEIKADGTWYHEGTKIERESLVRLFASILRREEDGDYYLVTPVEKWRLSVELHPLIVTDVDQVKESEARDAAGFEIVATLNTGVVVVINAHNSLFLEPSVGMIAAMQLSHGLTALFSRAAWYRLVEMATSSEGATEIVSGDYRFNLGVAE